MIVGLLQPDEGRIFLGDEDIGRLPMYLRARIGLSYLPQETSVFRKLTVEENIVAVLETMDFTFDGMKERVVHASLAALQKRSGFFISSRNVGPKE
jgi:lipopolysaccharide export system ATP-binding protein